jgi:hypothetical protein
MANGDKFKKKYFDSWKDKISGIVGKSCIISPADDRIKINQLPFKRLHIICNHEQISKIAAITLSHYLQPQVVFWRVSDDAELHGDAQCS